MVVVRQADNQTEASNVSLPHNPVDANTSNTSVKPTPALPGSWCCWRTEPAFRQLHRLPNAKVCTQVGAQGVSTQSPQYSSQLEHRLPLTMRCCVCQQHTRPHLMLCITQWPTQLKVCPNRPLSVLETCV